MPTHEESELEKLMYVNHYLNIFTVIFGLILESSCLILFAYHIAKKTPTFCSQYFYLLTLGYIVAILNLTTSLLEIIFQYNDFFYIASLIADWYFTLFLGPWNTVLTINRCTALLFWQKHSTLWSGPRFYGIVGAILAYPIIGIAIMVLIGKDCFSFDEECEDLFDKFDNYMIGLNAINVAISATIGIATVLCLRYKIIQISRDTKDMEHHLLIQTIVSSAFFGIYCIYAIIVEFLWDDTEQRELMNSVMYSSLIMLSKFYLLYYHMSSTVLLFCLSSAVRKSFFQFYSCNQIKPKKQSSLTRVTHIKTSALT